MTISILHKNKTTQLLRDTESTAYQLLAKYVQEQTRVVEEGVGPINNLQNLATQHAERRTAFLPLALQLLNHGSIRYVRSKCQHNSLHYHLGGMSCSIPSAYLIPANRDAVQYGNLPDVCPLIRETLYNLHRTHYQGNEKVCRGIIQWMFRYVVQNDTNAKVSHNKKHLVCAVSLREDIKGLYVLILVMYGTLLGLYNGNTPVNFTGMTSIYRDLQAVLAGPRSKFFEFVCKHWNLAQLCLYELVVNLVEVSDVPNLLLCQCCVITD
jgi:hypothetical protein